eukprot:m.132851 g.132851  ORF g.132851 m.132851 type:complete len:52 (+) comp17511_c0_seq9:739-894(+)
MLDRYLRSQVLFSVLPFCMFCFVYCRTSKAIASEFLYMHAHMCQTFAAEYG